MAQTRFNANQIGVLGSENIGASSVGSEQIVDHGTHGIDLNGESLTSATSLATTL